MFRHFRYQLMLFGVMAYVALTVFLVGSLRALRA